MLLDIHVYCPHSWATVRFFIIKDQQKRKMNSTNDRRSNTPDGNGDPNASDKQEETDAEKEESDVIHEADDIERSTKTTEVEEDVSITMIRQTMHRLWETNDFLEESYKMDLEVRNVHVIP